MKLTRIVLSVGALAVVASCEPAPEAVTGSAARTQSPALNASSQNPQSMIGINVLLKGPATAAQLTELGTIGTINDQIVELNVVLMRARAGSLATIQALPYVAGANPDAERTGVPVSVVAASDFSNGFNTWDLDAVNVTASPLTNTRTTSGFTGEGVFVGVLDTGLLDDWRFYFPAERIATQYATVFQGGGANDKGNVATPTNKWEHDQNSHGTHVTSTILGYNLNGAPINGVAPKATVIPVKVLNQNGSGWSSMIAAGITYITDLKLGPLAGHPVVINMSLGGPVLDVVEKAAIDRAVANGVIIVASAGNEGTAGMGYPGAYGPVISAAASGWTGEWVAHPFPGVAACSAVGNWWQCGDVPEPTNAADFYITDFSSRALAGQDLDVAAPGSWVVGPFQLNSGKPSYFFLGGTSMASPHVAGIVALMAQKRPSLTAAAAEAILQASAVPLPAGSRTIHNPDGSTTVETWGADATGAGLATADAALAATP